MKEETRKVVVLDMEDKIKLQRFIKDLESIYETYQSSCIIVHVLVIYFII